MVLNNPLSDQCNTNVDIICSNLSYKVDHSVILENIYLKVKPGEILTIIGSSGSGKTTLLSCIANEIRLSPACRKSILYNGEPINYSIKKKMISFLPKSAPLYYNLTVEENLYFVANLRLYYLKKKERQKRVLTILKNLNLLKCKNTYVGNASCKGISIGETKRLMIGMELLKDNPVLVMDEIVSGVDSSVATDILNTVCKIARDGKTIIISVQQPTSQMWEYFSNVLLLNQGNIAYYGKVNKIQNYINSIGITVPQHSNPIEFFFSLLALQQFEKNRRPDSSDNALSSRTQSIDPNQLSTVSSIYSSNMNSHNLVKRNYYNIFRNSKYYAELIKSIAESSNDQNKIAYTVKNKSYNPFPLRLFTHERRRYSFWFFFTLTQIVQGFLLGGYFYDLKNYVADQSPSDLSFSFLYSHPFVDVFVNGLDGFGEQPILDVIQYFMETNHITELQNISPFVSGNYYNANKFLECLERNADSDQIFHTLVPKPIPDSFLLDPKNDLTLKVDLLLRFYYYVLHLFVSTEDYFLKKKISHNPIYLIKESFIKCVWNPDTYDTNVVLQSKEIFKNQLNLLKTNGRLLVETDHYAQEFSNTMTQLFNKFIEVFTDHTMHARSTKFVDNIFWNDLLSDIVKRLISYKKTFHTVISLAGSFIFIAAVLGFSIYFGLFSLHNDILILQNETDKNLYTVTTYFIAKNIVDLLFQIIYFSYISTIYYIMINYKVDMMTFLIYSIISFGIVFASYGFGYAVCATTYNINFALVITTGLATILLALSGFLIVEAESSLWVRLMSHLSFYKWAFYGYMKNQFKNPTEYIGGFTNSRVISYFKLVDINLWDSVFCLYSLGILYRLLAILIIYMKCWLNRK